MVLETAAPDSGGDTFYSSTDEHSAGPNPPGPFAKYPTKVTLPPYNVLKFLGFWSKTLYEKDMTDRIVHALDIPTVLVSRFPTQDETDAFIDAQNRRANTAFLADLVMVSGIFSVTQLIRQTADRPHMMVGPARIPLPASMRMRGLLFLPPVAYIGYQLGAGTSNAFAAVRLSGDQRLRGYYMELRKQSPQMLQRKMREFMIQKAREQGKMVSVPQYEQPQQRQAYAGGMDDASPTGGTYASEYGQSQDGQQSTIVSMAQQQQEEQRRQYYRQQQQQQQQPADQGQSFFDDDDDASPVARPVGGWQQQRQQQQAPQQSGSAWARIRQSSGAGSKPGPFEQSPEQLQQQWGQAEQSGADSFSYATSRDQSQSAQSDKELAQREFDRMLEQERQLGTGAADGNEEKRGGWRRG